MACYLLQAMMVKVTGMASNPSLGLSRLIGSFMLGFIGYPIIFHAGIDPDSAARKIRLEIVQFPLEAHIPIEFPVITVARIAFLGAPNLP